MIPAEAKDGDGGVGEEKGINVLQHCTPHDSCWWTGWLSNLNIVSPLFFHYGRDFPRSLVGLPCKVILCLRIKFEGAASQSVRRCQFNEINIAQHCTALHSTCYHLTCVWRRNFGKGCINFRICFNKSCSGPWPCPLQIMMIRMSRSTRPIVLLAIPELLTIISTFKVLQKAKQWKKACLLSIDSDPAYGARSPHPAFNSPVEWSLPNRKPNNINKPWFLILKPAAYICACLVHKLHCQDETGRQTGEPAATCKSWQTYLGASPASLWSERLLFVGCTTAFCRFGPETKPTAQKMHRGEMAKLCPTGQGSNQLSTSFKLMGLSWRPPQK